MKSSVCSGAALESVHHETNLPLVLFIIGEKSKILGTVNLKVRQAKLQSKPIE